MNIQVSAKIITNTADYIAEAEERRRALMGGERKVVNIAERKKLHDEIAKLADQVVALKVELRAKEAAIDEKSEVIRILEETVNRLTNSDNESTARRPPKAVIAAVLEDFPGITYADVIGLSRSFRTVEARHTCIYALRKARPDLSTTWIANLFGGRDHTSILHAIRKMETRFHGQGN